MESMDTQNKEIYYMVLKTLESGPCQKAAQALRQEIEEFKILPKRVDWLGNEHDTDLSYMEKNNPHIGSDHLYKICSRASSVLNKEIPPSVPGVTSLLGAGSHSLLRTSSKIQHYNPSLSLNARINSAPRLSSPKSTPKYANSLIHKLMCRETNGPSSYKSTVPVNVYNKQEVHKRQLGHLSAVYCIAFDRTGKYIITGADDSLVKIWSATDGRLLSTLRGHAREITDLAVNYENTLLAAGSVDKMIRVWKLRTTAPVCVLASHTQPITAVRFCPLVKDDTRYLISTGDDGSVCFWSWNVVTHEFESKPIKYVEKSKPSAKLICLSFSAGGSFLAVGSTDHFVRVYHINCPSGPNKILEIETHADNVDSLQFSNMGLRLLSGSKDGKAIIWWFERQEWKSITLNMDQRLPGTPVNDNEPKTPVRVNMVCWTCDDAHVITAVSDHSIKVWDSSAGRLVHTVTHHKDDVYVIEAHPTDPRIFLSAGHDGRIALWDVITGSLINFFYNQIEGQGHGAIYDCKFSPDGLSFAATDSHGHLSIYGFGSSDRYQKVPKEVFFHTDYRPLLRDANNYVIDEQTQCAPHLMPPPFLVDIDGNPHPPQYQRLVPGRENCNDEQLVPYIAVHNERGIAEILEPVIRPLNDAPHGAEQDHRPTIDDMIGLLQQQQERDRVRNEHGYAAAPSPSGNRRNTTESSNRPGVRQAGDVEGVRQSSGNWQSRDNSVSIPACGPRSVIKPMPNSFIQTHRTAVIKYRDLEEEYYLRERSKKQVDRQTIVKEILSKERVTRRKRRIIQQRQGVIGSGTSPRRPGAGRRQGIIDYENPEDLVSPEESGTNSSENSWTGESATQSESESEEEDDTWVLGKDDDNTRTSRSKVKENNRISSAKRRKVKKEALSSSEDASSPSATDSDADAVSIPENDSSKPGPSTKSSSHAKRQLFVKEEESDVNKISKYPDWLVSLVPKRSPYFPQVGDVVIYCRKGHEEYLTAVRNEKEYKVHPKVQASRKKNVKNDQLVKIVDIKYTMEEQTILANLKVSILLDDGKDTGDTFTIRYHDKPQIVDFFVLKDTYDNAIQRVWAKGDQFKTIIDDQWWFGTVVERIICTEYPDSWFQCYKVTWDSNKEEDFMSPWDIEPLRDTGDGLEKTDGVEASTAEKCVSYTPKKGEWPSNGLDAECDRIIAGLEKIMETSWAEYFNAPVDLNAYPTYIRAVPYPIDLSTIKTRLENRFYRRLDAIKFDLSYIEINAKLFNEPGNDIRVKARIVTDLCLRFVSDHHTEDPTPSFFNVAQNKDMYESTENEDDMGNIEEAKKRSKRVRQIRKKKVVKHELPTKNWRTQCKELLDFLVGCEDSEPFRHAVDPIQYPDYNNYVDAPMDLSSVREQLMSDIYACPEEFNKDMRLIFSNSRAYNTNKRSRIYSMTIRLSSLYEEKIKAILHSYRCAKMRDAKLRNSMVKPKMAVKKKAKEKKSLHKAKLQKKAPSVDPFTLPSTSGVSRKSPPYLPTYKIPKLRREANGTHNGTQENAVNGFINSVMKQNGYANHGENGHLNGVIKQEPVDESDTQPCNLGASMSSSHACHKSDRSNSETEIDSDKHDTDATEIVENDQKPKGLTTCEVFRQRKRKMPVKRPVPKKKPRLTYVPPERRKHKDQSYSSEFSDSGSCSSYRASTPLTSCSSDLEVPDKRSVSPQDSSGVSESDEDFLGSHRRSRTVKARCYVESKDSEYEYDTFPTPGISSRGRVRKLKGHSKATEASL